ncbi:DEAD/DEAH box helicase [Rheinheimera sp.]|uniref:DEAD/DEAH box helicase n=1 Tax=Rheinheimera sp. TaxID=1869214 RepID=UPI003D2CA0F0
MILRNWQSKCVAIALDRFRKKQKHFMVLATPGAGKTIMAASLAKKLFEDDLIDFVVCFAPSVSVQTSMQETFSRVLAQPMHGKLGAAGGVFTYQYLTSSKNADWSFLKNTRVLAVFDEIHHCGGQDVELANAWGREVLMTISNNASYIMAMTGTPWRTDQTPISLARYIEPDYNIQLDYAYTLAEAIRDNVCRLPEIVLIDNDNLIVKQKSFTSLSAAIDQSDLQYGKILNDSGALKYALSLGVSKLAKVREEQPDAAGLIVASSVEAAIRIRDMLTNKLQQTAVLVTYKENNPQEIIEAFRTSNVQWIVSVAMVSEGTDIPRLRVCVHLSNVRTELFYRQVLGRILRQMANIQNRIAYFITFAEQSMIDFTKRLKQDVPKVVVRHDLCETKKNSAQSSSNTSSDGESDSQPDNVDDGKSDSQPDNVNDGNNWQAEKKQQDEQNQPAPLVIFRLQGQYRQQVFSIF